MTWLGAERPTAVSWRDAPTRQWAAWLGRSTPHAGEASDRDRGSPTAREPVSIQATANRKNLLLLVTLRWMAVAGQTAAIIVVHYWLDIYLPIVPMAGVIASLVVLNLATLYRYASNAVISNTELFIALALDVAALTVLLDLSGGATNPFVSLFLLHVIIGAVLLQPWSTWAIVGLASGCFIWLMVSYNEIGLTLPMMSPMLDYGQPKFFDLYIFGLFVSFLLVAVLLVLFVTRINRNLREQDAHLAELRQHSAEEGHIVRMGLLASGAAHELGTPLTTLSVIVNDWKLMPRISSDPELASEIAEMQAQLARCKDAVSKILRSSGEARGEGAEPVGIISFIDALIDEWDESRGPAKLDYTNNLDTDWMVASDALLKQIVFNVLDNALEASPDWIGVEVARERDEIVIAVRDAGPGFAEAVLLDFGKPYQSTKGEPGRGLGLFLVVNVLRKLGGRAIGANRPEGGAVVSLRLPIETIAIVNAVGN